MHCQHFFLRERHSSNRNEIHIARNITLIEKPMNHRLLRSQAIRSKLDTFEKEELSLQSELAVLNEMNSKSIRIPDISESISRFMLDFEEEFKAGEIEAQKLVVRKW